MRGSLATILSQIAEVRSAQRMAAEQAAVAAVGEVRQLEARRSACVADFGELQEQWRRSVSGSTFDPSLAGNWATAILIGEARLGEATDDVRRAEERLAADRDALRQAHGRADCARTAAACAARSQRQAREDRALANAADAFLARWVRR